MASCALCVQLEVAFRRALLGFLWSGEFDPIAAGLREENSHSLKPLNRRAGFFGDVVRNFVSDQGWLGFILPRKPIFASGCPFSKRLEKGRFVRPAAKGGKIS